MVGELSIMRHSQPAKTQYLPSAVAGCQRATAPTSAMELFAAPRFVSNSRMKIICELFSYQNRLLTKQCKIVPKGPILRHVKTTKKCLKTHTFRDSSG